MKYHGMILGWVLLIITQCGYSQPNDSEPQLLRIGIVSFYAPYVMQASKDQFYGFDISTMNYICAYLKKTCQFIPLSHRDLIIAVANNEVDAGIGALVIRPLSINGVRFTMPYMTSEGQFITLASRNNPLFDMDMFVNKKIGVVKDSAYENQIKLMNLNAKIKAYNTDMNIISAIRSGELDYGFVNSHTALYWEHNSNEAIQKIGNTLPIGFGIGILVNTNNINLIQDINVALYYYQNGPFFKKNYDLYLNQF